MNKIILAKSLYSIGIFTIFFIIFIAVFFFLPYIHETGHIIFGFADGLIKGKINDFTISAQIDHPLLKFIPLPQQTKIVSGKPSLNFTLGGPIFMILIFFMISLLAYSRSKNKLWFLIFLSILIFEISGDIICGTDNFIGNPLSICNHSLDMTLQFISIALFSGTLSYFVTNKFISWKPLKIRRK